ncbi:zinc-dependent alcohol dehydrogenase [Jatrophihabitans fulvus]
MRAATWQGKRDVRIEDVPDPKIQEPNDAIIRVTTTNICGSDLHLYEVLGAFMNPGDVLGHEAMGIVEEVGSDVTNLKPGDRVVVPFQISCGHCFMCAQNLQTQCETTQVREYGTGASLFGYSKLYGEVAGGQAEYLRVPQAQYTHIKVPQQHGDERWVYLSDVLPTAWQAVEYAAIPDGGTVVVLGLGPIGDMAARIARYRGHRVIGVDLVPERLDRVRQLGVDVLDLNQVPADEVGDAIRDETGGRGPDSVIDAVGMEAHGSPGASAVQKLASLMPDAIARPIQEKAGVDRLAALTSAIDIVRRGGTVSLSGVYGGAADPLPLLTMFDKQLQFRMGQANVLRWVPQIMPLLEDEDALGVDGFATHRIGLDEVPQAYEDFQEKKDGAIKYVITP